MATIPSEGPTVQLDDVATLGGEPTRSRDLRSRGKETVARLLRAGQQVIEERGHDQTRVDDIVATAGLSHGTFYLYFKDREDLLHSLVRATALELAPLGERLHGPPTAATLASWMQEVIRICDSHAEVLRAGRALGSQDAIEGLSDQVSGWLRGAPDVSHPGLCADMLVSHLERCIVRDDIVDCDELAAATLRCAGLTGA